MKKAMLMLLLFAGISFSSAQVEKDDDRQENILDKIEQEPQRPAQVAFERDSRFEAKRIYNEKKAEKKSQKSSQEISKKTRQRKSKTTIS